MREAGFFVFQYGRHLLFLTNSDLIHGSDLFSTLPLP